MGRQDRQCWLDHQAIQRNSAVEYRHQDSSNEPLASMQSSVLAAEQKTRGAFVLSPPGLVDSAGFHWIQMKDEKRTERWSLPFFTEAQTNAPELSTHVRLLLAATVQHVQPRLKSYSFWHCPSIKYSSTPVYYRFCICLFQFEWSLFAVKSLA